VRARSIKPGFFQNEQLAELAFETRLLFIGLWCMADRAGRLPDRPKRVKIELFPADAVDADRALEALAEVGLIQRYQVGTERYIQVTNFTKHQYPHHRETASVIPAPEASPGPQAHAMTENLRQAPDEPEASPGPALLTPESGLLTADSGLLTPGSYEPDTQAAPARARAGAVERVFNHWRSTHEHPRAQLDAKRRKLITGALKSYTEADLCQAITGYTHSAFHRGENDKGRAFDDISLFLRDGAHIDAGIKLAEQPPRTDFSARTRGNVHRIEDWQPPEVRSGAR